MKIAILVPKAAFDRKETGQPPCLGEDSSIRLVYKKGTLNWLKETGATLSKGEPVCEALVEKAILDILAPVAGYLAEKCLQDGDIFSFGDTLGYIEDEISA